MGKFFLILTLGLSLPVFAGPDAERAGEIRKMMWEDAGAEFTVSEVPEKWSQYSAIIMAQDFVYRYKAKTVNLSAIRDVDFDKEEHYRIKIQDKSSLDRFTEFYFEEDDYVGFKIIKPDGSEDIVDLEKAVPVENEDNKKIAIPNLENGDILDFYFVSSSNQYIYGKTHTFTPIITTLHDDYPSMYNHMQFEVAKNFFINFKSTNGAPKLVASKSDDDKYSVFELTDGEREPIEDMRWENRYFQYPTIKFQVTYAKKNEKLTFAFIGEPGEPKTEVSEAEILQLYKYNWEQKKNHLAELNEFNKYMKQRGYDRQSLKDRMEKLFYFARYKSLDRSFGYYRSRYPTYTFLELIGTYLFLEKISHDLIIGVDRDLSSIDNLLLYDEISLMLAVPVNRGDTTWIYYDGDITLFDDVPEELERTRAYSINVGDSKKEWKLTKRTIPYSKASENQSHSVITASLDLENLVVNVDRKVTRTGEARIWHGQRLVLVPDYYNLEKKKYEKRYVPFAEFNKAENKKEYEEIRQERWEAVMASDFDENFDELTSAKIISMGRTAREPDLSLEEKLTLKDMVSKAGPNLILHAGSFIGGQVEIDKDQMTRESDIHMPYARSFINEINFTIPEGYSVEGVDRLVKNVQNETGGFVSTAEIRENTLYIRSEKYYSNNNEPAENWPEMVEYLQAAYDFSQERVLLKKN